jgi:hypothetical protein
MHRNFGVNIFFVFCVFIVCVSFISSNRNLSNNHKEQHSERRHIEVLPKEDTKKQKVSFHASKTELAKKFLYNWERKNLGVLLNAFDVKNLVELGVQQGKYSEKILSSCFSCKNYTLVDLWQHQNNYRDLANVKNSQHDEFYKQTIKRLKKFENRGVNVKTLKMSTVEASVYIQNNSQDFIYLDARHDYCGVYEDLVLWLPKLKKSLSIIAGHDFLFANASELAGQDWSLCGNGGKNEKAVKGAVLDFFQHIPNVQGPFVSNEKFPSWLYYISDLT